MLLAGDDPTLKTLREQYHAANVTEHKLSGAGFFLKFSVPPNARRLQAGTLSHLGDVKADIAGLKNGAGFILHLCDGAIHYLEGFSFGEPWPDNVRTFRVSYIDGDDRDLALLWEKWSA